MDYLSIQEVPKDQLLATVEITEDTLITNLVKLFESIKITYRKNKTDKEAKASKWDLKDSYLVAKDIFGRLYHIPTFLL